MWDATQAGLLPSACAYIRKTSARTDRQTDRQTDRHRQTDDVLSLSVCLSVCLSYASHDSTKHMFLHRFLPAMAPSGLQSPVSLSPCPLTFQSIQLHFLFFHFQCLSVLFMKTVVFSIFSCFLNKFSVFSFLNFL